MAITKKLCSTCRLLGERLDCYRCARLQKASKPTANKQRTPLKRTALKPSRPAPATGEAELFDTIIAERGPKSQVSGKPLHPKGHPQYHWQFEHILPKGVYPKFRLNPYNIYLMTPEEHDIARTQTHKVLNDPQWQEYFQLKAALRLQYKNQQ